MRPYLAKVFLPDRDGACVGELLVLRPLQLITPKFLFYRLLSQDFIIIVNSSTYGAKMPRASWENFIRNLIIPYPTIKEQTAIANFLDQKTQQIDDLIVKKERLIELLKEERTAIINHAVTKGLDPNVPMKDSGIEWLGEIPEHWEVKMLKYISSIVLGKMLTNEDKGGYLYKPYLRAQNINWHKVNTGDIKKMWFSKRELDIYRLSKFDLLVSEGGEVGRTTLWMDELPECYIQNSVHKVSLNKGHNPHYFQNLFYTYGVKGIFDAIVSRVSIAHLTREKLKQLLVLCPPANEQEEIAEYIDNKSQEIQYNIKIIEQENDLLKEYKTALINEAVTGKIDVRDYQLQNPLR